MISVSENNCDCNSEHVDCEKLVRIAGLEFKYVFRISKMASTHVHGFIISMGDF